MSRELSNSRSDAYEDDHWEESRSNLVKAGLLPVRAAVRLSPTQVRDVVNRVMSRDDQTAISRVISNPAYWPRSGLYAPNASGLGLFLARAAAREFPQEAWVRANWIAIAQLETVDPRLAELVQALSAEITAELIRSAADANVLQRSLAMRVIESAPRRWIGDGWSRGFEGWVDMHKQLEKRLVPVIAGQHSPIKASAGILPLGGHRTSIAAALIGLAMLVSGLAVALVTLHLIFGLATAATGLVTLFATFIAEKTVITDLRVDAMGDRANDIAAAVGASSYDTVARVKIDLTPVDTESVTLAELRAPKESRATVPGLSTRAQAVRDGLADLNMKWMQYTLDRDEMFHIPLLRDDEWPATKRYRRAMERLADAELDIGTTPTERQVATAEEALSAAATSWDEAWDAAAKVGTAALPENEQRALRRAATHIEALEDPRLPAHMRSMHLRRLRSELESLETVPMTIDQLVKMPALAGFQKAIETGSVDD